MDSSGNVFVADTWNATVRKVTSAGVVTTPAGLAGNPGSLDGTGSAARFQYPRGVAVDGAGNLLVADTYKNTIRQATRTGLVTTLAGTASVSGTNDGTGSAARFDRPYGVAADSVGNVFVSDNGNNTIRKVTMVGVVTTLAGTAGKPGSADGLGSSAQFNFPTGLAVDSTGSIFVADTQNHTIRKVTSAGLVTTFVGRAGYPGTNDGVGSAARFHEPQGVAVDSAGNLFVADTSNHTIRQVTPAGAVTTLAGNAVLCGDCPGGAADGTGTMAQFNYPIGVAVDSMGDVFVADTDNSTIRKVTSAGVVTTIGGVAGVIGGVDGLASSANFAYPNGIAVDTAGNLYVADANNNRISRGMPIYPWITPRFNGTYLQLSWPARYLGWELQVQTNPAGGSFGTGWFPVAGSATNTEISIPNGLASESVFYRLRQQ